MNRVLLLLWAWVSTVALLVVGEIVISISGKGDALTLYNAAIVAPIMSVFATLAAAVAVVRTGRGQNGDGK